MQYPEHDKLAKIQDASQAIGEFLEWLQAAQQIHLVRWGSFTDTKSCPRLFLQGIQGTCRPDCARCGGTGQVEYQVEQWVPDNRSITSLLGDYFGIDSNAIEWEKRAMLEELRRA